MAQFLWLKFADQAPIRQQTDKSGRLYIPTVAARFSLDTQSIRLNSIGFNWERDATSPAYGYTDSSILEQITDTGRSKAQPIVVDGSPVAGDAPMNPTLLHSSLFNAVSTAWLATLPSGAANFQLKLLSTFSTLSLRHP